MTAAQVVSVGGLGKFSASDLRKLLTGKVASARPTIGELDEGLTGGGSRKDLETMFQLIYLTFTQPRRDAGMFQVMTSQTRAALANQKATPEFAFSETLQSTLNRNHLRARPMTPELVDQMDLDKSLAFYKDRFSDASDFTFVFVGSFDLPTMKPFVERYLAALPSTNRKESWKDIGMIPATGVIEKRVDKGIEPKSRAQIVFTGPFRYNQEQRVAIRAMSHVLEVRLRETLREELGGTYSVSASPGYSKYPREEYTLSIAFGSSPDRTDDLVKGVFREIDRLKASGPTEKELADVKQTLLRDQETSSKQNMYLLSNISLRYQYSEDLATLFTIPEFYNRLTAAGIQDAARTYLNTNNYVKVTLFPETKQAPDLPYEPAQRRRSR
jgi:zinc protease